MTREYAKIKGAETCFVSLDKELTDLASFYKGGAILLGYDKDEPIAIIAIKKIDSYVCEAKRLYIKPESRGKGYARIMMNAMLERARALGFREVTFTTIPTVMKIGYGLYKRMGFKELEYNEGTVLMGMNL